MKKGMKYLYEDLKDLICFLNKLFILIMNVMLIMNGWIIGMIVFLINYCL